MPKKRVSRLNLGKLLWPAVIAVVVGVATPLILSWIQKHSPDIVVYQYLNTVESKKPVPSQIGGLMLDYQPPPATPKAVYVIEVSNDGSGPEEDLRVQVGFPVEMKVAYAEEPDLRVYRAEEVSLNQNSFFMSLKQFPSHGRAPVSFNVEDVKRLCEAKIKVAGKDKEGRVEPIKGVTCGI